jgi:hypothetical protein
MEQNTVCPQVRRNRVEVLPQFDARHPIELDRMNRDPTEGREAHLPRRLRDRDGEREPAVDGLGNCGCSLPRSRTGSPVRNESQDVPPDIPVGGCANGRAIYHHIAIPAPRDDPGTRDVQYVLMSRHPSCRAIAGGRRSFTISTLAGIDGSAPCSGVSRKEQKPDAPGSLVTLRRETGAITRSPGGGICPPQVGGIPPI